MGVMKSQKDPAFLFYSSDFLSGTMFFSDEQVGKYIRLLCCQHQNGHLKEKHMLTICGGYDEDIFSKFEQDENGLYYNRRLDAEILRRSKYTESRRKNASSYNQSYVEHMQKHMPMHMENETENRNENEIGDLEQEEKKENLENSESSVTMGESLSVETAEDEPHTGHLSKTPKSPRKRNAELTKRQQERFDRFWSAYPFKKSVGQARITFAKLDPDDDLLEQILSGIERAQKYDHRFQDGGRFAPHPSTWLNASGWLDKFDEKGASAAKSYDDDLDFLGR